MALPLSYYYGIALEKEEKLMLLNPVNKSTHVILNFEYLKLYKHSRFFASKGGWLLSGKYVKGHDEIALFLSSLFTNNVIMLPPLSNITPYYSYATFSSTNPTSPDCIFVVAHYCVEDILSISTYRNGDNKWKTKIFGEGFGQLKS